MEYWSDHKLCVACQTGIHNNHCRQQSEPVDCILRHELVEISAQADPPARTVVLTSDQGLCDLCCIKQQARLELLNF